MQYTYYSLISLHNEYLISFIENYSKTNTYPFQDFQNHAQ